ncbi:MAG: hypothetical protein JSS75_07475 [Bacteroidetes bacterium]|nr:hypothetical protein [Bacteroidota bacterium]
MPIVIGILVAVLAYRFIGWVQARLREDAAQARVSESIAAKNRMADEYAADEHRQWKEHRMPFVDPNEPTIVQDADYRDLSDDRMLN